LARILDFLEISMKHITKVLGRFPFVGKYAVDVVTSSVFAGSAIMIIGANFANFVAYIYHLVLGRLLGPQNYGELVSVISLFGILSVTFSSLGMVIIKFVSLATKDELEGFYFWIWKKALVFGLIVGGLILLFAQHIAGFMHIDPVLVALIGPAFLFSVLAFTNRSFLQGMLNFKAHTLTIISELTLRLVLGVVLVLAGLSVGGAVFGVFLSTLLGYLVTRRYVQGFKKSGNREFNKLKEMAVFALPVFVSSVSTVSFFSTDLILVKHFFESSVAGEYAALVNLGKIIFFGTGPISAVMFPLISKKMTQGKSYKKIFLISVFLTVALASGILAVYLFFPEIAIVVLYGPKYLGRTHLLFWFGMVSMFFTLSGLFTSLYLSINKTRMVLVMLFGAIAQAIGIWYFHDTLESVLRVSLVVTFVTMTTLVMYFFKKKI